jgi:hypothetical protein
MSVFWTSLAQDWQGLKKISHQQSQGKNECIPVAVEAKLI